MMAALASGGIQHLLVLPIGLTLTHALAEACLPLVPCDCDRFDTLLPVARRDP